MTIKTENMTYIQFWIRKIKKQNTESSWRLKNDKSPLFSSLTFAAPIRNWEKVEQLIVLYYM